MVVTNAENWSLCEQRKLSAGSFSKIIFAFWYSIVLLCLGSRIGQVVHLGLRAVVKEPSAQGIQLVVVSSSE